MKIIFFLFIFSILVSFECISQKQKTSNYQNAIPIFKEFLVHEWMIDSIYGSTEFVDDWVYFTPEGSFWRFSRSQESYLIDSSLQYNESEIKINGKTKYSIFSLDSNNILLVTGDNEVLRCKRWREFDSESIVSFLKANPKKKMINGSWELYSTEIESASISSSCDRLIPTMNFIFRTNGTLEIFQADSINKCATYFYRIYEKEISLRSGDMILQDIEILKLTKNELILKSKLVSKSDWSEKAMLARQIGYNLYFNKRP